MSTSIRLAKKDDMPEVLGLITTLAIFEKEPDAIAISIEELERDGFGDKPAFTCFVAESDNKIIGMALTYLRYSTWKGKALHLEDLIVKEEFRGKGLGSSLLDEVIKLGKQLKVRRICWEVLDWNTNAIKFYESKGVSILKDWYLAQMDETAIANYLKNY